MNLDDLANPQWVMDEYGYEKAPPELDRLGAYCFGILALECFVPDRIAHLRTPGHPPLGGRSFRKLVVSEWVPSEERFLGRDWRADRPGFDLRVWGAGPCYAGETL